MTQAQASAAAAQAALWDQFIVSGDELAQSREARHAKGTSAGDAVFELLRFRVGEEFYAVPLKDVHEIARVPHLTKLPHVRHQILGITALRGEFIPVFCIDQLLGLMRGPQSGAARRMLVLGTREEPCAIFVDEVAQVVRVDAPEMEPRPHGVLRRIKQAVLGLTQEAGHKLVVLEAAQLVIQLETPT